MDHPNNITQREWLRFSDESEAALFLAMENTINKDGEVIGYYGSLTIRDCARSVSIDLCDSNDDDLEALGALRDYAEKAINWIKRHRKAEDIA